MSLTLLKRSALPPSVRGYSGTDNVAISDGGQFRLSTTLAKKINGAKKFATGWADKAKRVYTITVNEATVKSMLPKGEKVEDYMGDLQRGKDGESQPYFAGVGILKTDIEDYDFKNSGTQSFPATYDEKTGVISFTVPSGKLAPKESTGRGRPKGSKNTPKVNGSGVAAVPEATSGTSVSQSVDSINLEEAE